MIQCTQWRNWRFDPGGQSLAEGGALVIVGGPTSQNSENLYEMIVNLWISWMSILDKNNENTPKKTKTAN